MFVAQVPDGTLIAPRPGCPLLPSLWVLGCIEAAASGCGGAGVKDASGLQEPGNPRALLLLAGGLVGGARGPGRAELWDGWGPQGA